MVAIKNKAQEIKNHWEQLDPSRKKIIIGATLAVSIFAALFFGFLVSSFFLSKFMLFGAGGILGGGVVTAGFCLFLYLKHQREAQKMIMVDEPQENENREDEEEPAVQQIHKDGAPLPLLGSILAKLVKLLPSKT